MHKLLLKGIETSLSEDLRTTPGRGDVFLWWLGQAGFALKTEKSFILIDPYLSDSLSKKYAGREFDHKRMMPVPVDPRDIRNLDAVLVTHRHTDHMDPETLGPLLNGNPGCRVLLPRAERARALEIGIPKDNCILLNAGETVSAAPDILVSAVPAAHETLEMNEAGEYRFLGYVLRAAGKTLYHSGDCVPYEGQAGILKAAAASLNGRPEEAPALRVPSAADPAVVASMPVISTADPAPASRPAGIHAALLPVNGRDEYRRSRNVPGNFTIQEAKALCLEGGIRRLFAHHIGMFAFNTADPKDLANACGKKETALECFVCSRGLRYELTG